MSPASVPAMTTTTEPLVALSTRIPESLRKQLKVASVLQEKDMQDVVTEALEDWLTKHEG